MAKSDGYFKPGNNGRPKGSQNVLTRTVKETVLEVFQEIQSDPKVNLEAFAKKYPREFYAIAARLIPTEINARLQKVELKIVRTGGNIPEITAPDTEASNGHEEAV